MLLVLALAAAGLGLTLPAALDFGVKAGSAPPYQSRVIGVQNNTTDPIWIARVAPAGDPSSDFRVVADSCSPHTLKAGATCSVTVEFAPAFRSGSAQVDDQLLFWGDGPSTYQAVQLRGVYDGGHATGGGPPVLLGWLILGGLLLFYVSVGVILAASLAGFLIVGTVIVVRVARRAGN